MSSLTFRLWLTYALLTGIVLCLVGAATVVYLVRNPYETRLELNRLNVIADLLLQRGEAAGVLTSLRGVDRLQTLVEQADQELRVRIAIYDVQGNLLIDSRRTSDSALPTWAYFTAHRGEALPAYRDAQRRTWLYATRLLEGGDYLLITAPRPRPPLLQIIRNEFIWPSIRTAALVLSLALLLAFGIARWVAAPLERMAAAARSVSAASSGSGFHPLPLEGPREAQTLAQAFNEMVTRVQAGQQAQRDFVANVSHELKTPLTSIQGFAQAILDGAVESPAALSEAAGVIYAEAGRMYRLVLDLLDLARLDAGIGDLERAPVDLEGVLKGVAARFAPQAQAAGVNLQVEALQPGALPVVLGDGDRLAQVFTNLVDNALKYTPPGGTVELGIRMEGEWVEIRVADTGPGIPPGELERVFERFYQLDKSRPGGGRRGSGLGLPIAREIVDGLGGKISAHTPPSGAGTVFVVRLPTASRGTQAYHSS